MNARETINTLVSEMIAKNLITEDKKAEYINYLGANDQMAEYFAGQMLRQKDYTNKTMELANQRREFESLRQQEMQAVESERRRLMEWETQTRNEIERLRSLEGTAFAQSDRLARAEQVLRDYNLIDQIPGDSIQTPIAPPSTSTSMSDQKVQAPMSNQTPNGDFLSRQEATQAMQEMLRLQTSLLQINNKHHQLFGQPLQDDIVSEALQSGIAPQNLESYWRTKYAVDAREATLREQKEQADMEALRTKVRQEIMSELATDPSRIVNGNMSSPLAMGSVMEHYAASRATAGNSSTPDSTPVAPERRPDLAAHANRVSEATRFFSEHFTADGQPRNPDSRVI